ncbi:MAG: DUF2284 domain-containing protein [Clostridia bacterium]|nr:DUF2284 domain-containing protein [Clostridia bacterium]
MIIEKITGLGFDNVKKIPVSQIPFEPSLISLCEMNTCGNYKRCYTCPPYVGKTEELVAKAKSYDEIIVFQKIYRLEDSFDIEGMSNGMKDFKKLVEDVSEICRKNLDNYILLSAGGCRVCERCGAIDNIPCRFPDKAYPSLESYSIQVSSLAKECGINYINGQNTVTYFGGILVNNL